MTTHQYRVVKKLPWIEGGKPAPGFQWEGGRSVVYAPGDTVEIDDRDLKSVHHRLEGIDEAGREALEAVRAEAEQPGQRYAVADLHERSKEWIRRSSDEHARRTNQMVKLCLRQIAYEEDPSHEDLAEALEAVAATLDLAAAPIGPEPPPQMLAQGNELLLYTADILRGKYRKPGRKAPPRTTEKDLLIQNLYHHAVEYYKDHFARQRQKRAPVKRRAKEDVAYVFGISVRTVERIVAKRPLTKDSKT